MPVTIITGSQTYNRPSDWNDANNSLEFIGAGAGGASTGGVGGGGGAYAKSVNVTIASSNSVSIGAGGGTAAAGGPSYFHTGSAYAVYAAGGGVPTGGQAGSCIYNSVAYSGGSGGDSPTTPPGQRGGGGGGGAAGASGGGSNGAANGGINGGAGGSSPTVGGGSGGVSSAGGSGNNGTDFTTHGAGSGAGGGAATQSGGHGGFYGGGGGGGGTSGGVGGSGRSGLGVITYTAAVPSLSLVTPSGGSILGGTAVTITGSNFTGATAVTFDGTTATSINVVNSTTITCVTPAHAQGLVSVAVTGPGGTGSSNLYRYGNTPFPDRKDLAISSVAPSLTIVPTIWYPPTSNLVIQGFAPALAFAAVSPNISPARCDLSVSSFVPTVTNTAFRNLEIPQANLFTDLKTPFVERTIRNPAFDIGAQLVMSKYAPTIRVTTDSVPIDIINEDDIETVHPIYAD